jgi:type I restriction enzyme, S subunit
MIKEVSLIDVCDVIAGQSPPSTTYNQIGNGIPFFQGKADFGEKYPTIRYWCTQPIKLSEPNDILFSLRAPVGPTNINKTHACIGRGLAAIRCKKIELNYLLHFLRGNEQMISDLGTGSTFKAITIGTLKKVKIPLPPLPQQKKIAAILDAADAYRQKTKALIAKYDELTQSLFLEMFGDPVRNEKGWEYKVLNELVTKLGDGIHGTPNYSDDGEYFFVNGNNLHKGKVFIDKNTKKVTQEEFDKHKRELGANTVLVSINGTIGKVAFYDNEPIILGKSACYFNLQEGVINKSFLYYVIDSPYFIRYAGGQATGSTIKNVSLKSMRNFPIPYPPIEAQTQFAERVQKIEVQKAQAQESLEKAEELFNSLLGRAFKGWL